MNERDNVYEIWFAEREECDRWCQVVDAAMPPFLRVVPRDPVEAKLLRASGTPGELIGPERRPSDEMVEPGFWGRMGRRDFRGDTAVRP